MMTELQSFPRILLKDGTYAYGGSQKWYHLLWRRLSGCGAVSATNLAAYYGVGMKPSSYASVPAADGEPNPEEAVPQPVFDYTCYRKQMNFMFREHMTSGRMGFPDPNRYVDEFIRYAARFRIKAVAETQYTRSSAEEAYALIKKRLSGNDPLVLLILMHTAKELDDITWHWMTVTGLDEAADEVVVSNYGKRETYPASVVFAPLEGNQVHLIAFDFSDETPETAPARDAAPVQETETK